MSYRSVLVKYIIVSKINSYIENNYRKEICFFIRLFFSCFNVDNFILKFKLKKKGDREREILKFV